MSYRQTGRALREGCVVETKVEKTCVDFRRNLSLTKLGANYCMHAYKKGPTESQVKQVSNLWVCLQVPEHNVLAFYFSRFAVRFFCLPFHLFYVIRSPVLTEGTSTWASISPELTVLFVAGSTKGTLSNCLMLSCCRIRQTWEWLARI